MASREFALKVETIIKVTISKVKNRGKESTSSSMARCLKASGRTRSLSKSELINLKLPTTILAPLIIIKTKISDHSIAFMKLYYRR